MFSNEEPSEQRRQRILLASELLLFALAVPLLIFPGRWAPLGLFFLGVQFVLRRIRTGQLISWSSFMVAGGLILLMALGGVMIAPARALALNRLYVLVLGIATFFTVVDLISAERHVTIAGIAIIVLGIAFAVISFMITEWSAGALLTGSLLTGNIPLLLHLPGSGVPTDIEGINPRLIAGTMAFLLPLPVALLLFSQGKGLRIFGVLSASLLALPLILSQSPQGIMGVLLAVVVMLAWWDPRSLIPSLLLILLALGTWSGWHWWLPEALVQRLLVGVNARLEIWPQAWQMIRDMPFTGVGLNNFPAVYGQYAINELAWIPPHAHNIFLQTAVDFGILGLVAFVALISTALLYGWRAQKEFSDMNAHAVILGCVGGVVAFVGFGLWDTVTLGHKPAPAFWALLGILAASHRLVPKEMNRPLSLWLRYRYWLVAGLAALVLITAPYWGNALFLNFGRLDWHRMKSRPIGFDPDLQNRAASVTQLAINLYPENSRAYFLSGLLAADSGEVDLAISEMERALEQDLFDYQAHFELADLYDQQGNTERALAHYVDAGAGQALYTRGYQASKNGEHLQAEHWFALVTQVEPTNQKGWLFIARAQKAQQAWDAAAISYQEVIRRFPDDTPAYAELGAMLLNQLEDPLAAQEVIEQGMQLSKSPDPHLLYLRSRLAVGEDEFALAEKYANQAIKLAPDHGVYLAWLGDLYKQQGRYEEALAQYELAAQEAAGPVWIWKSLEKRGQVFVELGDLAEANTEFDRAVQLGLEQGADLTSMAGNYVTLGDLYLQEGDTERAIHAFYEAVRHDPQNQKVADRLKEFQAE